MQLVSTSWEPIATGTLTRSTSNRRENRFETKKKKGERKKRCPWSGTGNYAKVCWEARRLKQLTQRAMRKFGWLWNLLSSFVGLTIYLSRVYFVMIYETFLYLFHDHFYLTSLCLFHNNLWNFQLHSFRSKITVRSCCIYFTIIFIIL